jgi:hypothetical protein
MEKDRTTPTQNPWNYWNASVDLDHRTGGRELWEGFKEKEIISPSAAQHVHQGLCSGGQPPSIHYSEYAAPILQDEQAEKNSSKG